VQACNPQNARYFGLIVYWVDNFFLFLDGVDTRTIPKKQPVLSLVYKNVVGNMIGFTLEIADSKQDMTGIKLGPLGWHTNTLTTELQKVRHPLPFFFVRHEHS
jgi:hypothetical protein